MLNSFLAYLQANNVRAWHEVTTQHIRQWIAFKSTAIKPRTLFSYKQEVKLFFRWMYRNEYLLVNPWDDTLDGIQPAYTMRYVPRQAELLNILDEVGKSGKFKIRNRAILELVYSSGIRRCELHKLNINDMRHEWIKVRGKGDHERLVPLGAKARHWIRVYIGTERLGMLHKKDPYEQALFISRHGKRLGIESFNIILKKGGVKKCTLHSLRHACATHMLENGADIRVLQKLLGHRKLSTTQLYTKVNDTGLKMVLENFHPRG